MLLIFVVRKNKQGYIMELFNRTKNNNKPLIRQIIDLVPKDIFNSLVLKFKSELF